VELVNHSLPRQQPDDERTSLGCAEER